MEIREGGLDDPRVAALVRHHRAEARASTPSRNAHSLDLAGLAAPGIAFFAAWDGEALLGIGALHELAPDHGELKSMRTAPAHLRRGVARAMLTHLIAVARARGYHRLSLETGTAPMFAPSNRMYEAAGFVDCAAFGGYPASAHNRFMTLDLETPCPRSS
ncbi:putative acetyltransferase [Hephaestia caeni]|uniref:Putative acetyltransferase n=1 Tax=Hephaestia caeni TaxID=645617 RepID=A0A397P6Y1_9SPHN|nr:GNAT family N-acetyltransferase [Hephaestia caeni]RIA44628.1 putative acetyltransferase [Hephaestia caeni]